VGYTVSKGINEYVISVLGSSTDGRSAFSTPLFYSSDTPKTDEKTLDMQYNGAGVYTLRVFFYSNLDYKYNPANFLYQSSDQTVTVG